LETPGLEVDSTPTVQQNNQPLSGFFNNELIKNA